MRNALFSMAKRLRTAWIACALAGCASSHAPSSSPATTTTTASTAETRASEASAASLNGTKPPEWQPTLWMNTPPLRLADLRGKVVLVRWWTANCPFCSATAPALRKFDKDYGAKGLLVVGMYHHKDEGAFDPRIYQDTAKRYGFTFPIAFDPEWRTLKSWMNGVDTGWTSVTFVLDKKGIVRHVHPGGQYIQGDATHAKLTAVIEQLIAEN